MEKQKIKLWKRLTLLLNHLSKEDKMKTAGLAVFLVTFVLSTMIQISYADETLVEGMSATGNDAKRGIKKGAHRTQEALCMDSDLECAAKKAKNRIIEAGDATADGASKIKNKID